MKPKFSHRPRKRFGQNFLKNPAIIQAILNGIQAKPTDNLIEIGPGLGALTFPLLDAVNYLSVIEIDRDLSERLKNIVSEQKKQEKINIHEEDALTVDFNRFTHPMRIVGNLPYNITTPLIFHLLRFAERIKDMYFMLQKEVVMRLCATPNDKAYGRLTVMTQYYCDARYLFTVPPNAFHPKPKVDSAIIQLIPRAFPVKALNVDLLNDITRTAFTLRRKTLSNALKSYLTENDFTALNLNPQLRPENISVQDFVNISNYITQRDAL